MEREMCSMGTRALGGEWRHAPKTMASVPASEKTDDEEASPENPRED